MNADSEGMKKKLYFCNWIVVRKEKRGGLAKWKRWKRTGRSMDKQNY